MSFWKRVFGIKEAEIDFSQSLPRRITKLYRNESPTSKLFIKRLDTNEVMEVPPGGSRALDADIEVSLESVTIKPPSPIEPKRGKTSAAHGTTKSKSKRRSQKKPGASRKKRG